MGIKTGRFFFLTFCCIITPISGIVNCYGIMKIFLKNREKIRTNQVQYTLNIMKILRAASFRMQF